MTRRGTATAARWMDRSSTAARTIGRWSPAEQRGSAATGHVGGQHQVDGCGPRVGPVTQAGTGLGVEVLGEPRGLAGAAKAFADRVGKLVVAGAAQPVLDQ